MAKIPLHPKNPERICWGCDKYCPADSLACGNGTIRTPHPAELFGADWLDWAERDREPADSPVRKGDQPSGESAAEGRITLVSITPVGPAIHCEQEL